MDCAADRRTAGRSKLPRRTSAYYEVLQFLHGNGSVPIFKLLQESMALLAILGAAAATSKLPPPVNPMKPPMGFSKCLTEHECY